MSLDLSLFIVEHIIIHEIIKQNLHSEKEPPIYSEIESSLNDDMKKYIKDKIIDSVGSTKSFEVIFEENTTSPIPECIKSLLNEQTSDLVQHSKAIADHLNLIQGGTSPGGLVTVVLGRIRQKRVIGVLKLEKEEGARLEQTTRDGLVTYDMLHLRDLILTEKTKLFKIGIFLGEAFEFDGMVCDNQLSLTSNREVADFFLRFLGCELMGDPKVKTKEFFITSQEFFKTQIPDPIRQMEYNIHLVSYVTSQTGTLNAKIFANTNLNIEHRQPYLTHLSNKNIKDGNFRKDNTLITNKIKKVIIGFESGVTIMGDKEPFKEKVRLEPIGDGRTRAEIIDNIRKVGT